MFRSFRRSGPPPFQVMSNSWRGPTRDTAKAGREAGGTGTPGRDEQQVGAGASISASQAEATEPGQGTPSPSTQSTLAPSEQGTSARGGRVLAAARKPTKPAGRAGGAGNPWSQRLDVAKAAVASGAAWLGGVTLRGTARLNEKIRQLTQRWQGRPSRGGDSALPRQTVIVGFAALAVVMMIVVWSIRDRSVDAPLASASNGNVKDLNLDALRPPGGEGPGGAAKGAAVKGVDIPFTRGPELVPPSGGRLQPPEAPQPAPKIARTKVDPRETGQRYYILVTYDVTQEKYAQTALEYLWSQGVEAAAINGHNSRHLVVVALQGFTREQVNKGEHKSYEDQLRAIGRRWKAAGGDEFRGIYAPEYKGGPVNFSLTKAN